MKRNLFTRARTGGRVRTTPGRSSRGGKRSGGSVALVLSAFVLLTAFVASPASGQAATDSASPNSAAGAVGTDPEAAGSVAPVMQPVTPEQEAVVLPRSMRVYWHVFGAFGLAWLLIFAYVASLGRRFADLEREVIALAATPVDPPR